MNKFVLMIGFMLLAISLLSLTVTDVIEQGDENGRRVIINRPFEEPAQALATFAVLVCIAGVFLSEENEVVALP